MKLGKITSLTCTACFAFMAAQPAFADEHAAPTSAAKSDGPALWKVADEDTTIYLFGTVHALPEDVNWYSGGVKDALDESEVLVTELVMNAETISKIQSTVGEIGIYRDGTTFRGLLKAEDKADYEAAMTKLGLPVDAFDSMEPWLVAQSLTQVAMIKAGINPNFGTELVLDRTIDSDVQRKPLETVAFQLNIFDSLPFDTQLEMAVEAAREVDKIGPYLNEIIKEWAEGDVERVGEMLTEAVAEEPEYAEKLFFARNKTWAKWIDTRLDTPGTVFMAVGAGHLAGEKSVQDYLTERGIVTTRVQ